MIYFRKDQIKHTIRAEAVVFSDQVNMCKFYWNWWLHSHHSSLSASFFPGYTWYYFCLKIWAHTGNRSKKRNSRVDEAPCARNSQYSIQAATWLLFIKSRSRNIMTWNECFKLTFCPHTVQMWPGLALILRRLDFSSSHSEDTDSLNSKTLLLTV